MPQPSDSANRSLSGDRWLIAALLLTVALYVALLFMRPTGENWGRGWNLVAFFLYSTPTALIVAGVSLWRMARNTGPARRVASGIAAASLLFPLVCIISIQAKA